VNGRAVVVAGPSGEGKTTLACAASVLPGVTVLTDERVALRRAGRRWIADGTPWPGQGRFARAASAPVAGVFVLHKSDRVEASSLTPIRALAGLVRCHFPAGWIGGEAAQLEPLEALVRDVPCFRLRTRLGGDAHLVVVDFAATTRCGLAVASRRGALVAELLRAGTGVELTAFGTSMSPAIEHGDRVRVAPVRANELAVGDVAVVVQRGQLVAHRVVSAVPLRTRGDALRMLDEDVATADVLGRVTDVRRSWPRRIARPLLLVARAGRRLVRSLLGRSGRPPVLPV
jgi:hypothetical protein